LNREIFPLVKMHVHYPLSKSDETRYW